MKRIVIFLPFILFAIISCGKEVKYEAFNPNAFAYDLDSTWEVNATVNIRGFEQHENSKNDSFEASLSYTVDIVSPDGKKIENLDADDINLSVHEKIVDVPVETQFELDTTYASGKYELIFNIKDNYSGKTVNSKVGFDLTK